MERVLIVEYRLLDLFLSKWSAVDAPFILEVEVLEPKMVDNFNIQENNIYLVMLLKVNDPNLKDFQVEEVAFTPAIDYLLFFLVGKFQ